MDVPTCFVERPPGVGQLLVVTAPEDLQLLGRGLLDRAHLNTRTKHKTKLKHCSFIRPDSQAFYVFGIRAGYPVITKAVNPSKFAA